MLISTFSVVKIFHPAARFLLSGDMFFWVTAIYVMSAKTAVRIAKWQNGSGHRDRYIGSLFRVDVPVPMIHWFIIFLVRVATQSIPKKSEKNPRRADCLAGREYQLIKFRVLKSKKLRKKFPFLRKLNQLFSFFTKEFWMTAKSFQPDNRVYRVSPY